MDILLTADNDSFPIKTGDRICVAPRASEFNSFELLKALPAAVYTTDAMGRITFYNDAAVALWGFCPELGKSEWCGSWRLYWPDGTPMPHDQCPMATALKEERPIRGAEAVAARWHTYSLPCVPNAITGRVGYADWRRQHVG